jgi:GNAT superfamily N-acetyltransferase
LDDRSQELATRLVAPLTTHQRRDLVDALTTIDRLTRASTVTFDEVAASHPEAIEAMTRYFAELDDRFDGGFDPGDTLVADAGSMSGPPGAFVVAHSHGAVVGCGGVKRIDSRTTEIKRMWIDPAWRGLGLGLRLLANLESHATRLGHRVVKLDTNSVLVEAITMYERSGYRPVARYNDNPYARRWFEKRLTAREPRQRVAGSSDEGQ